MYSFVLFLYPKFIFLALAKTTTNIHNLSFLLIFVLGGVLKLIKGKDVELIEDWQVRWIEK
jgi:hypothetical protein